jgi:hypothetical protein
LLIQPPALDIPAELLPAKLIFRTAPVPFGRRQRKQVVRGDGKICDIQIVVTEVWVLSVRNVLDVQGSPNARVAHLCIRSTGTVLMANPIHNVMNHNGHVQHA